MKVNTSLFDQVVALGDANKQTLGFLPWAGFVEAARRGHVLAALGDDGSVAGYCLFDLPGSYVRITHLCIDPKSRGEGVARALIDTISDRNSSRFGLRLKCRTDWPADKMWPRLGFAQTAQVVGRSKAGHKLTIWWRSHGHEDLLSFLLKQNHGRRVAVDANVYSDLHSGISRSGAHHSAALAPLISDEQIKIVVSPSTRDELYSCNAPELRERLLSALVQYEQPDRSSGTDRLTDELIASVSLVELAKDPSLRADARFIAEAILADVEVAVSRDENAVMVFADRVFDQYNVTLVNPSEIRSVLDAVESPGEYRPAQLLNTGYTTGRPYSQQWRFDQMQDFLDKSGGERRADFSEMLRRIADRSTGDYDRWVVSAPDGAVRAAWVTSINEAVLSVPLLRVAPDDLRSTIARLLAFHLRQVAVDSGCDTIEMSDRHSARQVLDELQSDGFSDRGKFWEAKVSTFIGQWTSSALTSDRSQGLVADTEEIAEIERTRWPMRVLGAGISNYLIPIRGARSADLLGYPATLDHRPDFLGLSREHVYYKAAGGRQLTAPGRILWFASQNPQEVVGCSRFVESITGAPNNLYRRFARYGVYDARDVREAASRRSGLVEVIRFADTEIFDRPVTLDRLRRLIANHSAQPNLVLRSASAIDDELFEMIYREGTTR